MNKNHSMANYGQILIGYLYKLMANLCTLLQLANGLLNMLAQIGLPVINFHGLRHTNATVY